jgi:hypothetical protein
MYIHIYTHIYICIYTNLNIYSIIKELIELIELI